MIVAASFLLSSLIGCFAVSLLASCQLTVNYASVLRRLGAQINAVDCTVSTEVCRKYGVDSYPTLKWFGAADSNGEEYSGGRT